MNAANLKTSQKKNLADSIRRRLDQADRCKSSPELQAIAKLQCKRDIVIWVNDWVWTYDPRRSPSNVPFDLFPRQEEYLRWRLKRRLNNENGLTEKSRDMGITWLNVCHQVHCWLFEDGFKGAFGSRKETLVDRIGDLDSIFEKIRFLLRMLPSWMLPRDFDWSRHDNFCKLINPSNGATITGEAGANIGRGGRSTFYDWDETAFTPQPQKVDAALSNNTDVVFYTSSANGMGNLFYHKRMAYPSEWVFRFHWHDDPRKDEEWYKVQCVRFDPVTVASEIDIDYGASIEGIFIPSAWVQAAINLDLPPSGEPVAGLDVAGSGKNLSVFIIRHGPVVRQPISWHEPNTTQTAYKVRDLMLGEGLKQLNYDGDGIGNDITSTYATHELTEPIGFDYNPTHGASAASDRVWAGESRTSYDKFANKRAELWGLLRERFRKTYNYVQGVQSYPLDELISIPNHPQLIAQLSAPLGKKSSNGKTLIESKEDMARRGVSSPDFADALAETEEVKITIIQPSFGTVEDISKPVNSSAYGSFFT